MSDLYYFWPNFISDLDAVTKWKQNKIINNYKNKPNILTSKIKSSTLSPPNLFLLNKDIEINVDICVHSIILSKRRFVMGLHLIKCNKHKVSTVIFNKSM